ncbi:thioredoxin family protein [Litorimonas sp. RW-G-Af-16]|uniref:thioredoxin family protein n=1 Tax=Litorimonas sp. RW-G-Af-16 TaxID=3241168 RepID=UPI00390C46AD
MLRFSIILAAGLLCLSSCATPADAVDYCANAPEGDLCSYDATRDAKSDVAAAQATARARGQKTIIAMGANWCHDSRALAGHLDRPRFQTLINDNYQLVFVDVGQKNQNLDVARSFGLDAIVGTPTVIITDSDGEVLNLDTAPTWRNAASRSEADIYNYFERFATE